MDGFTLTTFFLLMIYLYSEISAIPQARGVLILYDNVGITWTSIVYPENGWLKSYSRVTVKFPPIPQGKFTIVKFISTNIFEEKTRYRYPQEGDSTTNINLDLRIDAQQITGKVLFLQCTGLSGFDTLEITSYDDFGIKNTIISPGLDNEIRFAPEEISCPRGFPFASRILLPSVML